VSLTDPQNDAKCRDCGALTQHATGICDDCRSTAGRLVTALAAMGVKAEAEGDEEVTVDGYAVAIDDDGNWSIRDYTGEVDAETAIAAIVQAPGLRAENATLAAEVKRLREELEKPAAFAWHERGPVAERDCGHTLMVAVSVHGWRIWVPWTLDAESREVAFGPETGDAGRHAADLALLAAGYRLVGGVHPLPDEVPDAR
jgi:hypothetical protein